VAPIALVLLLFSVGQTAANSNASGLETKRLELEVKKLDLEVQQLEHDWPSWTVVLLGIFGGVASGFVTIWVARRTRRGELDQATHEGRLRCYPKFVVAMAPLALYFPEVGSSPLSPAICGAIGRSMSQWYFDKGGLLLSTGSRDAYFRLARALTLASYAEALAVPNTPEQLLLLSKEKIADYRKELRTKGYDLDGKQLETGDKQWKFGEATAAAAGPAESFRDFVFLQGLSSELRTALSEDLRGRRRPA